MDDRLSFRTGVVLCTPFTGEGMNLTALERLLEFQIAGGTEAVLLCGIGGEGLTLTEPEFDQVVRRGVAVCRGRALVVACTGNSSTAIAQARSRRAEALGADGVMVVAPFYNRATPEGLLLHYRAVAGAINLPVIVSNVPLRTGVSMDADTILSLARIPGVAGIKEAGGAIPLAGEVLSRLEAEGPSGFALWAGNDNAILPYLSLGAAGVISVVGNLVPNVIVRMVSEMLEGDWRVASGLQRRYMGLIRAMFLEVNPIPAKTALGMMGHAMGPLRLPLCEMAPANQLRLAQTLGDYGLL